MKTNRISELLDTLGITRKEFAEKVGVSQAYLNLYISGNRNVGNIFLQKITKAYPSLNPSWMLYGEGKMFGEDEIPDTKSVKEKQIPVFGTVTCGTPVPMWDRDGIREFLDMPMYSKYKDVFAVKAEGNSMRPYINPGDYLICADLPERVQDKTAVVVVFKSVDYTEANAKLILHDERRKLVTLYSINTQFPPMTYEYEQVHKVYKVIAIHRKVK